MATTRTEFGEGRGVMLGHARLSIIDLHERSNQPMTTGCGRYEIVFNGEIYNYKDLAAELRTAGVVFATESDTEVLLQCYARWGARCLERLDGMFAIVVFDRHERTMFFARDAFGIKPLYFRSSSDGIAFASEIAALARLDSRRAIVDTNVFASFLLNGFLYEPDTGFTDIQKLGSGEYLTYDCSSGRIERTRWYDPLEARESGSLADLIKLSVNRQSRADVPVGLFFSGGLDSTVLGAAYPGALTGFYYDNSAGPTDVGIDHKYARAIAHELGMPLIEHNQPDLVGNPDAIIQDFREVAIKTEEPVSDFTYLATRQLSQLARERGYKVMLSGMGGDELFAGYPRMRLARHYALLSRFAPIAGLVVAAGSRWPAFNKRAQRAGGFIGADDFAAAYTRLIGYFSPDEVDGLLGKSVAEEAIDKIRGILVRAKSLTPLKQAMLLDRYGFLPHNLTVTDRASMAVGLEARVPLMTRELADWAFLQPDQALINFSGTKRPLRQFAKDRLPHRFVDRPKQGFNPPLDGRIRALGRERIAHEFKDAGLYEFIDEGLACQLLDRHFSANENATYKIWQLLYFGYWTQHWSA